MAKALKSLEVAASVSGWGVWPSLSPQALQIGGLWERLLGRVKVEASDVCSFSSDHQRPTCCSPEPAAWPEGDGSPGRVPKDSAGGHPLREGRALRGQTNDTPPVPFRAGHAAVSLGRCFLGFVCVERPWSRCTVGPSGRLCPDFRLRRGRGPLGIGYRQAPPGPEHAPRAKCCRVWWGESSGGQRGLRGPQGPGIEQIPALENSPSGCHGSRSGMGPFPQWGSTGLSFLVDTDCKGGLRSLLQGGLRCPEGGSPPAFCIAPGSC